MGAASLPSRSFFGTPSGFPCRNRGRDTFSKGGDTILLRRMVASCGNRSWIGLRAHPGAPVDVARYGEPVLVRPRLGQGAFRIGVTDVYQRRCAVTGERTLPILDAAHIRPYGAGGQHEITNGLLLRTDVHRLFDLGYVTVSGDGRFEVGRRLKEDFENGRLYYEMHGRPITLPDDANQRPARDVLEWHQANRFLG